MITLKQLAESLNGNYWEKGNLQRVYLDKGNNTKKMSTKTFVFQDENGEFKVSCKVYCPSQPWEWCKSQEESVKKTVYRQIEDATATEYYFAKKKGTELYFSFFGNVSYEKAIDCEAFYSSEQQLLDEMDNCGDVPEEFDFITISREEVEKYESGKEKKSIFDWTVEEIRQEQIKNYTGGLQTDPHLAQNIYNMCRNLEKQGKDDNFLRKIYTPLAIHFVFHLGKISPITVVGTDSEFSFWQIEKGKVPVPLASTAEKMYWCYEIYEGTPINKSVLDNDKTNPKGKILHTYESGYFNC